MIAPLRLCAPHTLPFSTTATGTSPSRSDSASSSARSWSRRFAQASPAGPPPTIATPTSMRSSSGSVGGETNSCTGLTGGGDCAGATRPLRDPLAAAMALRAPLGLHGLGQLGDDLVEVAHDAEVGELEDRCVRVLVDRDDVLRALHADLVLDRARDAGGEVELRRHRLAGLPDLARVREPAGVDHRPRRGDGAAEGARQLFELLEALGVAEAAAARDQDLGVLDVDVRAALLAALDHRRLGRPRRELDVDVLHRRRSAVALRGLERVQAPDDHAEVALVARLGDLRVLQDRPGGDQLAVVDLDLGDLHRHAGALARG